MELKQIYAPMEDLKKIKEEAQDPSAIIDYPWLSEQLGYILGETGKDTAPGHDTCFRKMLLLLTGNI